MFNIKSKKYSIIGRGIISTKNNVDKPLSNFEIILLMTDRKNKTNEFLGVFTRDELPHEIKNNQSLILNLDNRQGNGTHWTCVYNDTSDKIEYFDSYGLPPPEEVIKLLKKTGKKILYSTSQIQSTNSVLCGYYCIYYINERENGKSMYDIIYNFEQITDNILDPKKNSKILMDYFKIK